MALVALVGLVLAGAAAAVATTGEPGQIGEPVYDEIAGNFSAEGGWSLIPVCAISVANPNAERCAVTSATHEYSIENLPPGEYVVYFPSPNPSEMLSQYYRQAFTRAEAQPIGVKLGFATRGVDEVMSSSPGPALQKPLPDTPVPVNHVNTEIPRQVGPQPPPNERTEPELVLPLTELLSRKSLGSLSVLCRFGACHGSIKLVTHVIDKDRRRREAVLGWVSFSLKKEVPATVAMHLTPVGREDLARGRRRPVSASIVVVMGGATVLTRPVRLS